MNPIRLRLTAVAVATLLRAANDLPLPAALPLSDNEPARWMFSLLPKSFTPNPTLEMTIFTEMTDAGRALPAASPQHPVYYTIYSAGFRPMGMAVAGESPPMPGELSHILDRTLAARGYLPANGSIHPPTIALIYYWGSHSILSLDDDLGGIDRFPELRQRQILENAALIGGPDYERYLANLFNYGSTPADHTAQRDYLLYQADNDLYFAVLSAYRYADVAHNRRRLAWRTTMTVNAQGVAMRESLAPLIVTGGNYFGRATPEVAAILRSVKRGTVDLGPLRVVDTDTSIPPESKK